MSRRSRPRFLESFGAARVTIEHARQVPGLGRFLLGRFFYSDAVNTVIVVMTVRSETPLALYRPRSEFPSVRSGIMIIVPNPMATVVAMASTWLATMTPSSQPKVRRSTKRVYERSATAVVDKADSRP